MDYSAILRHAWSVTRRERRLWGFGLVSAAASVLSSLVFGFLYAAVIGLALASELVGSTGAGSWLLVGVFGWIEGHAMEIVVALVAAFLMWSAVAVIEVAAAAGLIRQADEAVPGRPVSFSEGLAFGWGKWWRMAALYAVAALPSLVSMLMQSIAVWYAIVLGGSAGEGGASVSMALNVVQPFTGLLGLLSIPVGAIVIFAYRFGLLCDLGWRSSLSASWGLLKSRLIESAGLYVMVWLVSLGVGIAVTLLAAIIVGAASLVVFAALAAERVGLAITVGAAGAILLLLIEAVVTAAFLIFSNVAYNSGWRSLTAPVPVMGEAVS